MQECVLYTLLGEEPPRPCCPRIPVIRVRLSLTRRLWRARVAAARARLAKPAAVLSGYYYYDA